MEQGIARKNPPAQIQIEGVVLMPLVVGEDHLRAEGDDLVQDPDHAYDQNGQEEGGNVDVARLDLAGEEASARLDAAMQAAGCRMRHMFHLWDRQGRIRYVDGKTKNSRDRAGPGPLRRWKKTKISSKYYTMPGVDCQSGDFRRKRGEYAGRAGIPADAGGVCRK